MVGALRFPVVMDGMIEESTTRSASTPMTRVCGSTTARGSVTLPILQVHEGWKALSALSRMKASICSSVSTPAPGWISRPRKRSNAGCAKISRVSRTQARISSQSADRDM